MAIPQKPLELNLDPDALTLDDIELLHWDTAPTDVREMIQFGHLFRQFLIAHTNWSEREVGALTASEIGEVSAQVRKGMGQSAVPLASKPRSKRTRGKRAIPSPTGPTS